jgi:hypothetical protein
VGSLGILAEPHDEQEVETVNPNRIHTQILVGGSMRPAR